MTQAARTKRWRARRRHGIEVLRVAVPSFDLAAALIESGRLTVPQALERRAVEGAAAEVLMEWIDRWRNQPDV